VHPQQISAPTYDGKSAIPSRDKNFTKGEPHSISIGRRRKCNIFCIEQCPRRRGH